MKMAYRFLPVAALCMALSLQIAFPMSWPCDNAGFLDCDAEYDLGQICGSDEDDILVTCFGDAWVLADLYACNGTNETCAFQSNECNIIVRYDVYATEVYCCEAIACHSLDVNRENDDCVFEGWCLNEEPTGGEALNRMCNDLPCTGIFPSPMPSTEPVLKVQPGSGSLGWPLDHVHIPAVP